MRSLLITSLSLPLLVLNLQAEETNKPEEKSTLPAMKVLPVGSSLHKIRAPRFDESYKKVSLLTADEMKILSNNQLQGIGVDLTLYKNEEVQATTHLTTALYFKTHGILHTDDNITISANSDDSADKDLSSFNIAAQGLTLQIEKRAGFLLGKTQTIFYSDRDQKMTSSILNQKNSQPLQTGLAKTPAKAALVLATIPALLSAEELHQIETFAAPSTALIQEVDKLAQSSINSAELSAAAIDLQKQALHAELTKVVETKTSSTTATEQPVANEKSDSIPVSIQSDNGMYFDAVNGLIVYSKDISVTHPQYELSCSKELKIQLKHAPAETTNTGDASKLSRFDGLDSAIATGDVVLRARDNKNQLIVAKAQTVSYDGKTGIAVLKGGNPTITQGDTTARVLSDSGYIMILPNMSTRIEGRHEIKTNLKKLQNKSH